MQMDPRGLRSRSSAPAPRLRPGPAAPAPAIRLRPDPAAPAPTLRLRPGPAAPAPLRPPEEPDAPCTARPQPRGAVGRPTPRPINLPSSGPLRTPAKSGRRQPTTNRRPCYTHAPTLRRYPGRHSGTWAARGTSPEGLGSTGPVRPPSAPVVEGQRRKAP